MDDEYFPGEISKSAEEKLLQAIFGLPLPKSMCEECHKEEAQINLNCRELCYGCADKVIFAPYKAQNPIEESEGVTGGL